MQIKELRYYLPTFDFQKGMYTVLPFIIAPIVLVALIVGSLAYYEAKEFFLYPTRASLERMLHKELAPKADAAQVVDFLDRHKIGHGSYHAVSRDEITLSQEFRDFSGPRLGSRLPQVKHRIYSGCNVANLSSPFSCWAHVWFYFDDDGKLIDYYVGSFCDGL